MGAVVAGIIGLAVLLMQWHPGSKVVLLPEADGRVGSVIVKTDANQQVVSTAYGSASTNASGAIKTQSEDPTFVKQHYAATLDARPPAPVSFVLYFEFGSAVDIAPAFKPVLEQLLAAMPSYPAPEITVIGHTDRVGTLEANDALSLQRAYTVRDLLLQAGVKADSITAAGRGEREPVVSTDDEVPEQKNRRVEVNLR
ncbi:MAG: OmpA family protein [Burkholderiaceae bacterium]